MDSRRRRRRKVGVEEDRCEGGTLPGVEAVGNLAGVEADPGDRPQDMVEV